MSTTLDISSWTARNGQTRRYIKNWPELVGLEYDTYKTGNIRSASLRGEPLSNTKCSGLLGIKVWLDDADEVHVDYNSGRTITDAEIIAAVKEALS